jgi:hypothetical protein
MDTTKFKTVLSVTTTQLTLAVATTVSVASGDLLVNLGADNGGSTPAYDGNGVVIYTDMDYSNTATNNTVLTDSYGRYRYFHKGIATWELARSSSGPIALYINSASTGGPFAVTNNAGTGIFIHPSPQATDFPDEFTQDFSLGISFNKVGATSGSLSTNYFHDGLIRWGLGEDYYSGANYNSPDRSYFALLSDKGECSTGAWASTDIVSISWGGAESQLVGNTPRVTAQSGVDGPKFRYNAVFAPATDDQTYSDPFQYSYYCPTLQTGSGAGVWNSFFSEALYQQGTQVDFPSGGLFVNVSGTGRPGLLIQNHSLTDNNRSAFITGTKTGGTTGFKFGVDILGANTQNWGVYDIATSSFSLYVDPTGGLGINTSAGSQFVTAVKTQNAVTGNQIENNSIGTLGYAAQIAAASGTQFAYLAAFSTGYTTDATLAGDAMVFSVGTAAMLHFGTGGAKRMSLHATSAKLGIGIDPPVAELQVNGGIALLDGMTAPSTITGYAYIYVDTADGDLKVKFGDGTVKTIVVDT